MEVFKKITNYEGYYEISNLGNVISCYREIPHSRRGIEKIKSRVLKQSKVPNRYCSVTLQKNGIVKTFLVHRLVANEFLGKSDLIVDHINGDKWDNRVENLRFVTHRENNNFYYSKTKKSSKFSGVHRRNNKWIASATIGQKRNYLGIYNCETVAHFNYLKFINGSTNTQPTKPE